MLFRPLWLPWRRLLKSLACGTFQTPVCAFNVMSPCHSVICWRLHRWLYHGRHEPLRTAHKGGRDLRGDTGKTGWNGELGWDLAAVKCGFVHPFPVK
nr:putative effector protein Fos1_2 [Fusarium oxysporum f. sp. spinaciae]